MLALSILKPDSVLRKGPGSQILKGLLSTGKIEFRSFKKAIIPENLLRMHYHHVINAEFFPWLIRYMSSYPSYIMLTEINPVDIEKIREYIGSTNAHLAEKNSLRFSNCPFGGMNGIHFSENEESSRYEVDLWQRELNIKEGDFSESVHTYITKYENMINNTLKIRKLCVEIEYKEGVIDNKLYKEIEKLLDEELYKSIEKERKFMHWLLLDRLRAINKKKKQ